MTDYIGFLRKGIDSAKIAERNKAEIDAVFQELNHQLASASNGHISVVRGEERGFSAFIALAAVATTKVENKWALFAEYNVGGRTVESKRIAGWHQNQDGYPCRIELGSGRFDCENRQGLESVLGSVLADSSVGEVLHRYMTMADEAAKKSGAGSDGST